MKCQRTRTVSLLWINAISEGARKEAMNARRGDLLKGAWE